MTCIDARVTNSFTWGVSVKIDNIQKHLERKGRPRIT